MVKYHKSKEVNAARELLKTLIPAAEMIGKAFRKDWKVVLHNLAKPENSVINTVRGKK